jgi:AmmeMemoRadiSam system protein A
MSPSPEKISPAYIPGSKIENEYSPEERVLLLTVAHQSISTALASQDIPRQAPSLHLGESRGVFTTLYLRDELRGCVGYALPITSLYRAVIETARGAAFDDPRFSPVNAGELADLKISLSVLSLLKPIRAEQVKIGRHGLLVTLGPRRGLLLPQVPLEHGWNQIQFLEQTCRKAGLPADAWQKGATLEAFTAEVFGEE